MLALETPPAPPPAPPALTARQLAGQHVVFPLAGTRVSRTLRGRIARGEAAGVVLFSRNVRSRAQVRELTRKLQAIPRPEGLRAPLLVMVDQEGGPVKRLAGAPARGERELAATGDEATAEAQGAATARNLLAHGVNVDLAPVVDVVRPGSAFDAEGRGFGGTAAVVTRFGAAVVRGLEGAGVAATAKHFPGFGAASANTDHARVRISLSRATLSRVDWVPFRAANDAGARLVMTSSAIYPALDRQAPALLSRAVVVGGLRLALRFDGVVVTDAMETPALRPYGSPGRVAVRAARAGNDLLLYAHDERAARRAVDALATAIHAARLSRAELQAGADRVLALRATLPG
jgi:beta-N-acetylhexosaminidase